MVVFQNVLFIERYREYSLLLILSFQFGMDIF